MRCTASAVPGRASAGEALGAVSAATHVPYGELRLTPASAETGAGTGHGLQVGTLVWLGGQPEVSAAASPAHPC